MCQLDNIREAFTLIKSQKHSRSRLELALGEDAAKQTILDTYR
jgi:hypothetical protein